MTAVMPITLVHVKATEAGARAASVLASGYSGLEVAGTLGGIVGSMCAVVALVVSVAAGNAKRRRQLRDDLQAEYQRGRAAELADREDAERRAEMYERRYLDLLESITGRQVSPPIPPRSSRQANPGTGDNEADA